MTNPTEGSMVMSEAKELAVSAKTGQGRPSLSRALLCLGAIALAFAFGASSAGAKQPSFDFCPTGEKGGECQRPRGLAVNHTGNGGVPTGTLYVADYDNNRIQSFDADGNFIRAWGQDVDSTGGTGFEICEVAANCKAGVSGAGAGQFISLGGGLAVDQATGNVYAVDRGNNRVQQFDATGHFIRAWGQDVDSTGGSGFEICEVAANCKAGSGGSGAGMFAIGGAVAGIATDSAGNVYVADAGNRRVQKFSSTGAFLRMGGRDVVVDGGPGDPAGFQGYQVCTVAAECKEGIVGSETCEFQNDQPNQLAASPAGDLYAVDADKAKVYRFDANLACDTGFAPPIVPGGGTLRAIAVNPADGHLLLAKTIDENIYEIDPGTQEVVEVTPAGAPFWLGLAVNPDSDRMYGSANGVLDSGKRLRAFDSSLGVATTPASGVTATSATLNGTVNPAGKALTECRFEYGESAAYGQSVPCIETPAEIGTGSSPVAVHADLAGLAAGTTYHFRILAANAEPEESEGLDASFTTSGPSIAATWSEDVIATEAVLKAEINPRGLATTYRFEYGTSEAYGQQTPELAVGSDSALHELTRLLSGLAPATTYHFRVVATNADAVNEGPDHTLHTYPASVSGQDPCANAEFRFGPGAALPDCRAYELVSPVDKRGGDVLPGAGGEQAREAAYRQSSPDGERVTYTSQTVFADALGGAFANQYLSSRGTGGWSTHALNPPQGTTLTDPSISLVYDTNVNFRAFSEDLCQAIVRNQNLVPLSAEAIEGYPNLYLRENCGAGADTYRALTVGAPPAFTGGPADDDLLSLIYASPPRDGNVVFGAAASLESTPPAAETTAQQIYAFSGGQLRLVSVLPGGEAAGAGATVGSVFEGADHGRLSPLERAISSDGSRIFWIAGGNSIVAGDLYVRIDNATTLLLASGAEFLTAATDGSRAIYRQGSALYEFDVDKALAAEAGETTQIAAEAGGVVGSSEDLSHLYFTSKEDLAEGATAGEYNLYLRHGGEVRFIATVSATDSFSPTSEGSPPSIDARSPIEHASHVTADGRQLIFMSNRPLTGYDNTDALSGEALSEVFRYDADADRLTCLSCRPSGARPVGGRLPSVTYWPPLGEPTGLPVAAWLPTWEWGTQEKRVLFEDGERVFFNALDALLPTDVNGAQDVYQWEAPGSGDCTIGSPAYSDRNEGCISLISTGKSPKESVFLDASANGRDVFFTTSSSIDPRDPGSIDVYDARAGGGFPPPPPPPPPCVGDACQNVPAPPDDQTPASIAFRGPGDPPAASRKCPKGKRRAQSGKRKGRCVKRKKRHGRSRSNRDRRTNR